jgi:RND superfamily putative drug exporter
MSRNSHSRNLAARMGRWSAAHWKTATFGWLALVLVAFFIGGQLGTKQVDPNTAGPGQSGRMDKILDAGFKQPAAESVLIQSHSAHAGTPAFAVAVGDVVARISKLSAVENIKTGTVSKDGHSELVQFEIRGEKSKAAEKVGPVVNAVAAVQQAHPAFFIGEFGDASAEKDVTTTMGNDLGKAGVLSLPLTLVILMFAFGALVAAGIPLLLALTAVFATFGLVALPSRLMPLDPSAFAVILLIGLAVGVDYSMFYLRREREERRAGRSQQAALEAAAATSGRSVLISGLTVMAAMAGMFLTGDPSFASFGYATMIVVAVAVLGSLTVLPALLSKLGDRVDRVRLPFVRRGNGEARVWGAIVDRVLRRPLLSALLAAGALLALAAPALQLRMVIPGPDTFPKSLPMVKTYDHMKQAFPGKALPANVVVKAPDVNAPVVRHAIARLEQRALATGYARRPITVDTNPGGTVANITIPILGTGADGQANAALAALRGHVVPETVGKVPGTEAGVTGLTAEWKDAQDQMRSTLPLVVGFVLVFAFSLMLIAFRSIVVAAKAIVLNLLSVAAAYGVLVLVFQHGLGKGLLGFTSTAGIAPVVPMLLFVILFGLSMDYHVFIVSRIRERFDRGASMDEAISDGIRSTAGVVTSAAVVMVAVFSVFATLSLLMFKQFGVGLAAAILIDATLVRGVLLPATMKLLGSRNWYLPRWLEWLPRLEPAVIEPAAAPEPAPPAPRPRRRLFTPGRIAGLVLVGLAVLGLGYLGLASGAGRVSVPAGSHAGQLTLHSCSYDGGRADCGTLVVPENRHRAGSRLIALPVTRIHARSAHPGLPIFRLQGGPGITNMTFPDASRFTGTHDVVLVGYRGVDGSSRLDCPEVTSARARARDFLTAQSYRADAAAFKACAERLQGSGVDLAGYTLPERVDDLDAARQALGYDRIDLVSESAGTRTAMIYAWRYPERIHRSVMLGANPPGAFLWDARTTGEQVDRYAALCAKDPGCRSRTGDLSAALHDAFRNLPDHWWFLPVKKGNVEAASFFGLMNSTRDGGGPLSGPMTIDTLLSARAGDASGAWLLSVMAQLIFPHAQVWGDVAAVGRSDAAYARRFFAAHRDRGSAIGSPGTNLIWAGGRVLDAWPASPDENEYATVRDSNVETLLVNGALDFATPPQNARELLSHLPNGRRVVLAGLGHTDDFWATQKAAGTRLIETYLDSGRVDTSLYKPVRADFSPRISQGVLAKIVLAVMLGFAGLTALSLVALGIRRGRIGRKKAAFLRSVYPVVLGLGGWFAGALTALVWMPTVPLDSDLLVGLSVGLPVGLGIACAAGARRVQFAAALAGAVVGAWLGFGVIDGLNGVVTAVVGATAGANALLLGLGLCAEIPQTASVTTPTRGVRSPATLGETLPGGSR